MNARSRRRLPWLVPIGILAATAAVGGLSSALPAGADPIPVLPALTPAQLLDKVRTAQVTTLSGDVTLTSNLGLPDLSALGVRSGTVLDLLAGTHHAHLAVDGPDHVRLALDAPQAERDWIRNGADLWSWDSASQHVQHTILPDHTGEGTGRSAKASTPASDPTTELDPRVAADQLLQSIDPTTEVSVRTPGYVAGRPVYELVVTPRTPNSTVQDGTISVDAATGVPLAVRIDARSTGTAALSLTFTSISFDQPSASTFAFDPPPGATVEEAANPAQLLPLGGNGGHRRGGGKATDAPLGPGTAPAVPVTPAATSGGKGGTTAIGTGWETVEVLSGQSLGRSFQALFANSPTVTVGDQRAHLVSTALINALVFDDGRIAVAAMTPAALTAAVAGA